MRWIKVVVGVVWAGIQVLVLSHTGSAQGAVEIRGIVRDLCGDASAGVAVRVWDGRKAVDVRSDAGGEFVVPGLTSGGVFALRCERETDASSVRVGGLPLPSEGGLFVSIHYGEAMVGETLVARLPTTPSTGYGWSVLRGGTETAFVPVGDLMEAWPDASEPRGEAGRRGHQLWLFRAVKPGTETVVLAYSRSWESAPPSQLEVLILRAR